jgi:hypothetical protein
MCHYESLAQLKNRADFAPEMLKALGPLDTTDTTPNAHMTNIMKKGSRRQFYIELSDWTWWAWMITTALLFVGLAGYDVAFIGAMAVTASQGIIVLVRDRSLAAFSVQLRGAYLLLMLICYPPPMRWLYWLPTVGTFALIVFGYCFLARILSLFPWNSPETYSIARLRRTFFSAPDLDRVATSRTAAGCAGGLCTIEAQVPPAVPQARHHSYETDSPCA